MRNTLSLRDGIALIVVIQISKIMIVGFPAGSGPDTWAAVLLASLGALPLMAVYARLVRLMPGKNIFEMTQITAGKPVSVIISILYAYYFLVVASITIGSFSEFVQMAFLYNTSYVTICAGFFIVCAYLAYSGSSTLGKWSTIVLFFSALVIAAVFIFSLTKVKSPGLVMPMEKNWPNIGITGLRFLAIPFGEAVILTGLAGDFEKNVNPFKLFIGGSAISGVVVLLIYLHNSSVLGQENMSAVYFPAYKAASIINIGTIGTRIEALVAYAFIIEGITKAAAGIAVSTRAVAAVFRVKDFRGLAWPVGLLCLAMATFAFHNVTEMFEHFDNIYPVYGAVFQFALPLLLWLVAEVRLRGKKFRLVA